MVAPLCNNSENITNNKKEEQALTDRDTSLGNIRYIDLYIIRRIWIDVLKTCLVGENFHLCPVVTAVKAEEPPKKPPYMKFKDLSLYKSPHCAYKEYVGDKIKCPDGKEKLLHRSLLPYVKYGRQMSNNAFCKVYCYIKGKTRSAGEAIDKYKNELKQTMRDPDNLAVRQAVVATGGLAGYMFGGGGGAPRRLFFTSAGLLSTGALCFPKKTDETFRNAAYVATKSFIVLYNKWCGKNFNLRENLACRDEPLPRLEEPPKEPTLESPQVPTLESLNEPPLESPQEPPLEFPQEAPLESPKEPPLESPKEPPLESPKGPPLESLKEPPLESLKEPPLESPKEPPLESPKEPPLESLKENPLESTIPNSGEDSKDDTNIYLI